MNRRIARHFFWQASPVNWLTCPLCFCIAPLCGTPMKNRASLVGGQSGASEKKVHHFCWELGPHFDECIAFPEKRASPFSKNVHHFFKNVQHFFPKCESPTSRIAQDFEKPSIRQILHDSCWIQLHWGKKGHTPAAFEVDQACTEAKTSKSFTTEKGPKSCQGPPKFTF